MVEMSAGNGGSTTVLTQRFGCGSEPRQMAAKGKRKHGRNFSQMHYARRGVITDEMRYVAHREKITPNWCAMKWLADA